MDNYLELRLVGFVPKDVTVSTMYNKTTLKFSIGVGVRTWDSSKRRNVERVNWFGCSYILSENDGRIEDLKSRILKGSQVAVQSSKMSHRIYNENVYTDVVVGNMRIVRDSKQRISDDELNERKRKAMTNLKPTQQVDENKFDKVDELPF